MVATATNLQEISPNTVEKGPGIPSSAVTSKSESHEKIDNNLKN